MRTQKEIETKLNFAQRQVGFWRGKQAEKHNLAKFKDEIAKEWEKEVVVLIWVLGEQKQNE